MRVLKKLFIAVSAALLLYFMCQSVHGEEIYYFSGEDISSSAAEEGYDSLLRMLPDELRSRVEEDGASAYSFEYFMDEILSSLKSAAAPAMKTLSLLLGIIILSCSFNIFAKNIGSGGTEGILSMCYTLCATLAVWEIQKEIFDIVSNLLDILNSTMLAIVPVMETVYITSGNIGTAAVSSTGINLMITLAEGMFSKVLAPGTYICFFLGVFAAVTKNGGAAFMAKTVKGFICGALMASMTLMSFVLALQSSAAVASDSFAQRTIRYAIGSYLPIVGGSVSESFSVIASGMGVIKQMSGIGGIAVLLIAFIPPFALLLINRLSFGAASAAAEMLGADREKELLKECGGICTLMIAVCAAAVAMYIIAIGIFCSLPIAVGG